MQRRERRGDEGAEDAERMPAGDRATQRAEAAGPQYPVQHQVGADVRATVPEAPGETAEHEQRPRAREPRDRGLLDPKSVVAGKRVSVRVDVGRRRLIQKKKKYTQ